MHHGPELTVVVIVCLVLTAGAATRAFSSRTRFPYTVAMLLLGLATGLLLEGLTFSEDHHVLAVLRDGASITPSMILFVFLPALVFESAYALDLHAFRKNLHVTTVLAVPALLLATFLTAYLMVGLTAFTWHWSLPAALVFGALISATDPVAVVAILRESGAPKRLGVLIEGESLLNDGTAIVVFTVLVGLLAGGVGADFELGRTVLRFLVVVAGGIAVGAVLGAVVSSWVGRTFNDPLVEITLTMALAYAAMILAEGVLHFSGVLAVVTAGLWMSGPGKTRISPEVSHFLHQFWEMLSYIANTLIFYMVGLVIAIQVERATAIDFLLIAGAWLGVMVIRTVVTFTFLPLTNRLGEPVTRAQATVMSWGGLRGAVSLALALMVNQHPDVPPELRSQILQVTAGVVLLTILVNGTTTAWLLRKLGFHRPPPSVQLAQLGARASVLRDVEHHIDDVTVSRDLRAVNWTAVREELEQRKHELQDDIERVRTELEKLSGPERAAGLWRRALSIERQAYWSAFSEGTLSATAAAMLGRELDLHLDRIGRGDLDAPAARTPEVRRIREWFFRLGRKVGLASSTRELDRLELLYDMSRAEARAAAEVRQAMARLEGVDARIAEDIDRTYLGYQKAAVERLEDLRVHLPEVTSAIETRLAQRIELNFERAGFEEQLHHGGMDPPEAQKALAEVEERMKKLRLGARRVPLPETADLCRTSPLFRDLPPEAVDDLARMTDEQVVSPGQHLFREGDKGDAMFIIARGAVHVVRGEGAEEELLEVLGGGEILGEMALLTGDLRTASARAATTVTLGRISQGDFDRLMRNRPGVRARVWEAFAKRLLDNHLRHHPTFGAVDREARRAWIEAGIHLEAEEGERLDAGSAQWFFLVWGSLATKETEHTAQALFRVPPDGELVARTACHAVRLGPAPAGYSGNRDDFPK